MNKTGLAIWASRHIKIAGFGTISRTRRGSRRIAADKLCQRSLEWICGFEDQETKKINKIVISVRGRFRSCVAVAAFVAITMPLAGAGIAGRMQDSAAAAAQTKKSAPASGKTSRHTSKPHASSKSTKAKSTAGKTHRASTASRRPTAQTIHLTSAFKASEQLRPMAQQLALTRSAAAYSGVENYARAHPGEGAAAAYLALGHAYMLDHRYADAAATFRRANASGTALDDYADYLGAQAAIQAGHGADAYPLLEHFAEKHPESIFNANAPVLLANAYMQQNDPQGALRVLTPLADTAQASHVDFRFALGRAYQMAGDATHAVAAFRSVYVDFPLSTEAAQARAQMQAMNMPPTRGRAQGARRPPLQCQAICGGRRGVPRDRTR